MRRPALSRRQFLKFVLRSAALSGAAMFSGAIWSDRLEPGWIEVSTVRLPIKRLTPAFEGFRLVQISDLHLDEWMDAARVGSIIDRLLTIPADAIAITGDFVTKGSGLRAYGADLRRELRRLTEARKVFAVLGNHDHWTDAAAVRTILRDACVIELRNQAALLERRGEKLSLGGVDDFWEDKSKIDKVISQLDEDSPAILMAHEPDFADVSAPTGRFDLQISGHSHGGQVVLPFFGPPILPPLAEKYPLGLYRVGSMWQYTNRGLGMVKPQVRFNCRPEITVFELNHSLTSLELA